MHTRSERAGARARWPVGERAPPGCLRPQGSRHTPPGIHSVAHRHRAAPAALCQAAAAAQRLQRHGELAGNGAGKGGRQEWQARGRACAPRRASTGSHVPFVAFSSPSSLRFLLRFLLILATNADTWLRKAVGRGRVHRRHHTANTRRGDRVSAPLPHDPCRHHNNAPAALRPGLARRAHPACSPLRPWLCGQAF